MVLMFCTMQLKVRQSIGVVFQAPSSDDILTGYENLKVHMRYSMEYLES